jgi:hypothetical protein
MLKSALVVAALLCTVASASAQTTITVDNFENGNLSAWTPLSSGQIIVDPLNPSNHALHFTTRGDGGDIWTATSYFATGTDWWLSFDYLGLGTNTGGYIGWDTDTANAGTERWLAGTPLSGGADSLLIDDGTWHHYVIHLIRGVNLTAGAKYLKAEDWQGGDSIAGNAYFDNIVITDFDPTTSVPLLSPLLTALLFVALLAVAAIGLRRSAPRTI